MAESEIRYLIVYFSLDKGYGCYLSDRRDMLLKFVVEMHEITL